MDFRKGNLYQKKCLFLKRQNKKIQLTVTKVNKTNGIYSERFKRRYFM